MRKNRSVALLSILTLLGGCATPAPPPVVVQKPVVQAPPKPQISADALKVLTQIDDMQETLAQLRNAVDLQQFEQQNSKRRQRQLYDDLDRRLRVLERSPRQAGTKFSTSAINGTTAVPTDATNTVQSGVTTATAGAASANTSDGSNTAANTGSTNVGTDPSTAIGTAQTIPSAIPGITNPAPVAKVISVEDEALAQTAYDDAFELLRKSRYQEAVVALGKVVQDYPASSVADDAQYWMAESYYVTRDFEQALLGFRTVAVRYQGSPKVPQALLKIGYIQYDMGAYDRARQTLQDVLVRFPESRVAIAAKARLEKMQREGR